MVNKILSLYQHLFILPIYKYICVPINASLKVPKVRIDDETVVWLIIKTNQDAHSAITIIIRKR
jgi:hypothetical protein